MEGCAWRGSQAPIESANTRTRRARGRETKETRKLRESEIEAGEGGGF